MTSPTPKSAFVNPSCLAAQNPSTATNPACCRKCESSGCVSRRSFLRSAFLGAAAASLAVILPSQQEASAEQPLVESQENISTCRNCSGSGQVPCELCSGTGFWRALSATDPKQKYKGVVCPECEGVGVLSCPVCLGTGEGTIKGLLRRRRVQPGPGRVLQSN